MSEAHSEPKKSRAFHLKLFVVGIIALLALFEESGLGTRTETVLGTIETGLQSYSARSLILDFATGWQNSGWCDPGVPVLCWVPAALHGAYFALRHGILDGGAVGAVIFFLVMAYGWIVIRREYPRNNPVLMMLAFLVIGWPIAVAVILFYLKATVWIFHGLITLLGLAAGFAAAVWSVIKVPLEAEHAVEQIKEGLDGVTAKAPAQPLGQHLPKQPGH